MSRLFFGLLLFSLATVCAPCLASHQRPPQLTIEVPVWVDAQFDLTDRAVIRDAFERWNRVLNGYERFYVVSENFAKPSKEERVQVGDWTVDFEPETNPWYADPPKGQGAFLAWVYPEVGSHAIHIIDGWVNRDIVEHEIGHALGLEHAQRAHNLMGSPHDEQGACIDDYTARRLAQIKGWNLENLKPECKL